MARIKTAVWYVDANSPDPGILAEAGALIRRGRLVAFPTETVYGLGVNASDPAAVAALFEAKGRPAEKALTLHLGVPEEALHYVRDIPPLAAKLIEAFWPGPLTLVLFGAQRLPPMVTGGLPTIGLRVPAHPVALGIISAAGVPLVAPSANLSGRPTPDAAEQVLADLGGRIDAVVDGGRTPIGVASTVLDVTGPGLRILRPGAVSAEEIAAVIGVIPEGVPGEEAKRPHWRPEIPLVLVEGDPEAIMERVQQLYDHYTAEGKRVGILTREERIKEYPGIVVACGRGHDARSVAASLYTAIRRLEAETDIILAEGVPAQSAGAVCERLRRAASQVIQAGNGL
ncbi:MAG TPA: threonylcarbamoyl-AMP synthase [Desulfotomaculum sp.]|nr:threonylcarbamoyl-AMP synthase [Desulfotomaculum sp.]